MDQMPEFLLSEADGSLFQCVNPHEVSPLQGAKNTSSAPYEPVRVKLEMEEFGDLAPYLSKTMRKPTGNSMDELNTPIIDLKEPFEYMVYNESLKNQPTISDPFPFEYDTIEEVASTSSSPLFDEDKVVTIANSSIIDYTSPFLHNNNTIDMMHTIECGGGIDIIDGSDQLSLAFDATPDTITDQGTNMYLFHSINNLNNNDDNEIPIVLNSNQTQQNEKLISANKFIKYEDNSVSAYSSGNQYSNMSSPYDDSERNMERNLGIVTPEDSNSSDVKPLRKKLHLKIPGLFGGDSLNTPDVIKSVVDLESQFNILSYVNEEDVTTVNIEDIRFENPSTSHDSNSSTKLKRRRRCDEDDEDYTPPNKKAGRTRTRPIKFDDGSDDDYYEEDVTEALPSIKRGRPAARRHSSISSDHSDASKYRELRDKNNEASRKSRAKRKKKEQVLEDECEDLERKNIKLQTKVEQLEKVVNNFRSNLFKIMLKK